MQPEVNTIEARMNTKEGLVGIDSPWRRQYSARLTYFYFLGFEDFNQFTFWGISMFDII